MQAEGGEMGGAVHDGRPTVAQVAMRCWGDFALEDPASGADLRPRGRKARAILAYIALHPGKSIGRERLSGLLWGERPEEQARASLRQAIHDLRPLANGIGLLAIDRDSLLLCPEALTTDLARLRDAVADRRWAELLDLLPEPDERLFADLDGLDSGFDDWLAIERTRQAEGLAALLAAAHADALQAGALHEARTLALRLRERDPDAIVTPVDASSATRLPARANGEDHHAPAGTKRPSPWLLSVLALAIIAAGLVALTPIGRSLVSPSRPDTTLAASGEVYSLYLKARMLIRRRNPDSFAQARILLERALALDPDFAPAWSSLAQVHRFEANQLGPAGQRAAEQALARARHALSLAPDLAEAHGVLGMIHGFESIEGQTHIRRAAALDPSNPEYQFWLGHVLAQEPDHRAALAAYRRAYELDPAFWFAAEAAMEMAWSLGDHESARQIVRKVEREGSPYEAHLMRGRLAFSSGDLSDAVRAFADARASTDDLGKQSTATFQRTIILFALDLVEEGQREKARSRALWERRASGPMLQDHLAGHLALRRGELPTKPLLVDLSRAAGDPRAELYLNEATSALIEAGRAHEAVALYDSQNGLLGFARERPVPASPTHVRRFAPTVAAALLAVGRGAEARRILVASDRQIAADLRRAAGAITIEFSVEAAAIWAMLGKSDQALAALEGAVRNGWINADLEGSDLPDDLGTEPAFVRLRGHPRFEAIRGELNSRLSRERAELARELA